MDTTRPEVQAMAVQGDRIASTGTTEEAQKIFRAAKRTIDLRGATVLPGIIDAHTHLIALGESYLRLNLKDVPTEKEIIERVKQKVASTTPNEWSQGWGWDETSNDGLVGSWEHMTLEQVKRIRRTQRTKSRQIILST